jgi:hypothetical protein
MGGVMNNLASAPAGSPVEYPVVVVGGKQYHLKFAHSAWFLLQQWGYVLGDPARPCPIEVLAAAAAGVIDKKGNWKSAGFSGPLDLLDQMIVGQETLGDLYQPTLEALKKVAPEADLTLATPPAPNPPAN